MQISIEPRKESDGSGILMMPLRKNVPLPRDPDWKLTICPECGRKCWDRPLTEGYRVRKKIVHRMCIARINGTLRIV